MAQAYGEMLAVNQCLRGLEKLKEGKKNNVKVLYTVRLGYHLKRYGIFVSELIDLSSFSKELPSLIQQLDQISS